MMVEMKENNEDIKYKVYLNERRSLVDAEFEQSRLFDKSILTLAAGAFGLSLTFIRQIVPAESKPDAIFLLIFAWIFFGVSLLATLVSFLTSQFACSKQREILETRYFLEQEERKSDIVKNAPKNCMRGLTMCLNISSILFFIMGVGCFAGFSIVNL